MKKLLLSLLITTAPLFAVASAYYNITFTNHYTDNFHYSYQPNQLLLNKFKDQCIYSVEPGNIGLLPYNTPTKLVVQDSASAEDCSMKEKYVTWTVWEKYNDGSIPPDGMKELLSTVKFKHWWHSGYLEWQTKIVNIGPDPETVVTAQCKSDGVWKNCLSDSNDGSYGGLKDVTDVNIDFYYKEEKKLK